MLAGFTGIFGKLITLNEGLLVWYRVFFSAVILFIVLKLFRVRASVSLKEKIRISVPGLFITAHWVFFYASIKYANISIGVVCYCLTSFFTAIFEPIINRKPFRLSELLLSALTLLGIGLIFHFDVSYQFGIILGVISSAFAALYTIYNEKLVWQYDSKMINFYQMTAGTLGLTILLPVYLYFFPVATIIPGWTDGFYLLLLALFCTVTLYVLFTEVLKTLPAFTVNLTFNLEPVYAIAIAFLFFQEGKELNFSFYLGLLFIVVSVLLQSIQSKAKSPEKAKLT